MENRKVKRTVVVAIFLFCFLITFLAMLLSVFSTRQQQGILEDSIKSQLLSTAYAARGIINEYPFHTYNSWDDVKDDAGYYELRDRLRELATNSGAKYIYALKWLDGEYQFVLDSDPEDETVFIPYNLAQVHLDAFAGTESAGVNNVTDDYGTFHGAAVPVVRNGYVIGIVAVDIENDHIQQSIDSATRNNIIMLAVLGVTMVVMMVFLLRLLQRMRELQEKLEKLAHYDAVTGLPNRQYLFDYLAATTKEHAGEPFALLFIDLDNFKQVNDNAGHDAGDELLQYIANFLEARHGDSKSFRPSAGVLNVSARIGGDEFIQIVPGIDTVDKADEVAKQLVEDFSRNNYNRYIEKYKVGMSVGVALYPYHSESYHVLIKYADIAMYHAKRAGKNSWRIYSDEMEPKPEK